MDNFSHSVYNIGLDVVYSFSGLETVFRDDYRIEVRSLFIILERYVVTERDSEGNALKHEFVPLPADQYHVLRGVIKSHPKIWKKFLQHVYTSDPDEGPALYDKIKQAVYLYEANGGTDEVERKKLLKEFMERCYQFKHLYYDAAYPNFGACEECVKNIRSFGIPFKRVSKHKKLFKEKGADFWDLFPKEKQS